MTADDLHKFELRLCDYACNNIYDEASDDPLIRMHLTEFLSEELLTHLRLIEVMNDLDAGDILLSDDDLVDLQAGIQVCGLRASWTPDKLLHRQKVHCTNAIQHTINTYEAQDWSRESSNFAATLERPKLSLAEGVEVVVEWIRLVRCYKQAMGRTDLMPRPKGSIPTPADSSALAVGSNYRKLTEDDMLKMERLRNVINKRGSDAKAEIVIRQAQIGQQSGRRLLRILEETGEYTGFARPCHTRYRREGN